MKMMVLVKISWENILDWVQMTTLFRLRDLHRHSHNNNHMVKVRERSCSWLKENNVDCQSETGVIIPTATRGLWALVKTADDDALLGRTVSQRCNSK